MDTEERTSLEKQLRTYQRNERHLIELAAKHGGEDYLGIKEINQLHDTREAIATLKQKLAEDTTFLVDDRRSLEKSPLSDLTETDEKVLCILCEKALHFYLIPMPPEVLSTTIQEYDLSTEDVQESLEILKQEGHITTFGVLNSSIKLPFVAIELRGFILYAQKHIPHYAEFQHLLAYNILQNCNSGYMIASAQISSQLAQPLYLVDRTLELFSQLKLIEIWKNGGAIYVLRPLPLLKRKLSQSK